MRARQQARRAILLALCGTTSAACLDLGLSESQPGDPSLAQARGAQAPNGQVCDPNATWATYVLKATAQVELERAIGKQASWQSCAKDSTQTLSGECGFCWKEVRTGSGDEQTTVVYVALSGRAANSADVITDKIVNDCVVLTVLVERQPADDEEPDAVRHARERTADEIEIALEGKGFVIKSVPLSDGFICNPEQYGEPDEPDVTGEEAAAWGFGVLPPRSPVVPEDGSADLVCRTIPESFPRCDTRETTEPCEGPFRKLKKGDSGGYYDNLCAYAPMFEVRYDVRFEFASEGGPVRKQHVVDLNPKLLEAADAMAEATGTKLLVTSGVDRNTRKFTSLHKTGWAVDLQSLRPLSTRALFEKHFCKLGRVASEVFNQGEPPLRNGAPSVGYQLILEKRPNQNGHVLHLGMIPLERRLCNLHREGPFVEYDDKRALQCE